MELCDYSDYRNIYQIVVLKDIEDNLDMQDAGPVEGLKKRAGKVGGYDEAVEIFEKLGNYVDAACDEEKVQRWRIWIGL